MKPKVAFLWYPSEQVFLEFRDACSDRNDFATYAEWCEFAKGISQRATRDGITLRKVNADVGEFLLYCKVNSRPPDSAARKAFASAKAAKDVAEQN